MNVVRIESLSQAGVEPFAQLRDKELAARGLFVAESPNMILRALENGFEPVSLFCEDSFLSREAAAGSGAASSEAARSSEAAQSSEAARLLSYFENLPVYTASAEVLSGITGYPLTRGALCTFRRPAPRSAAEVVRTESPASGAAFGSVSGQPSVAPAASGAKGTSGSLVRRVAVVDAVVDAANVGTIFRGAAALGIGAVLLTPNCCDPLNRRTVRTSMGTVFQLPWGWLPDDSEGGRVGTGGCRLRSEGCRVRSEGTVAALHRLGFRTAAMALRPDALPPDAPQLAAEEHLAIILGNEGHGLPESTIADSDYVVCIPMARGVDSLNVAAAAAIAFWQLR